MTTPHSLSRRDCYHERALIDSVKRLYTAGRLTKEQIAARVEKGTIDEAEYEEITGEKYKAETKAE